PHTARRTPGACCATTVATRKPPKCARKSCAGWTAGCSGAARTDKRKVPFDPLPPLGRVLISCVPCAPSVSVQVDPFPLRTGHNTESSAERPCQYRITTCSTRGNPVLVGRFPLRNGLVGRVASLDPGRQEMVNAFRESCRFHTCQITPGATDDPRTCHRRDHFHPDRWKSGSA